MTDVAGTALIGSLAGEHPWLAMFILSFVQGVAEFLPISSSGHLVILSDLLGRNLETADMTIVLHLGTLGSILVFYWRRIWQLLGEDRQTVVLLAVATLPAVVVGLPVRKYASHEVLENPLLAGCLLPLTGLVLLWAARHNRGEGRYQDLSLRAALLIGVAQAIAILPGISRSGLTISAGMLVGLAPRPAAVFAFLLAIPAIGGAGLLEALSVAQGDALSTPWEQLAAGAATAFVVGLVSLWLLDRVLSRGKLIVFAGWVIPVGILYVGWKLIG